ncbi:hypothetical protein DMB38_13645 [Streptomyces sp. WAC 06738]|nr:hypothetical protein DMB38_13645 [Streptomyces sp. WAC 06738]
MDPHGAAEANTLARHTAPTESAVPDTYREWGGDPVWRNPSVHPDGPVLTFPADAWQAFTDFARGLGAGR